MDPMLSAEHRMALAALVGEQGLLTGADTEGYATPARYASGRAAAVVRPASTAEVSAVVGYCVRHGLSFVPQSGNTGLVGNATPDDSGTQLVLSLERLRAPLAVDVDNRSVRVGAGVRLSALNDALQPHGLFLPIDLGADPMMGGMISTNTAGARFLRYGDMRRHVLGLKVVLADCEGTQLDLMSALRKNNTGVDLKQLFIGTGGAFGVVTEAVLDVQPRPTDRAVAMVVPADVHEAPMALLRALERDAGDVLTAFEGISRNAFRAALAQAKSLSNPFGAELPEYVVLIELSASAGSETQAMERLLTDVLERAASDELIVDAVIGRGEQLWTLRHSISTGLRSMGHLLGFDLAFERGAILPFRSAMIAALAARFPQYQVCDFGHLGDGGVHFSLLRPHAAGDAQDAAVCDYVFDAAIRHHGGSFSGEHGIGRANQSIYDRHTPALRQSIAGALTQLFSAAVPGAVRFGPKPEGILT